MIKKIRLQKMKTHINYDMIKASAYWCGRILLICLLALMVVVYFGKQVKSIGNSMKPVINNGDIVLVNRMIYDASKPKRGDIIVFKPNGNENSHSYIRRIIGLPDETVQIKDKKIYINGKVLKEDYGTSDILEAGTADEEITLKGDEYFVLGDNRKNMEDSRMANIGNVKRDEIQGKAWFILSFNEHFGFI